MNDPLENETDEVLESALAAADAARRVTLKWFRGALAVDSKSDRSPVTEADREAEDVIRDLIHQRHPGHGFFGEESGEQAGASEWTWVIDPIDGTKSFATGMPVFGTLIAALHGGAPVIGVIDMAALDERWVGRRGQPTLYNGEPCRTNAAAGIADATVYTTTMDMFSPETLARAERLTRACRFRVFGGDCYGYALLALGFNHVVCEAGLKPYDFFALAPVVEGAGGVISDWEGRPLRMDSNGEVLAAAGPALHALALEKLAE